jgi:hypothetical protein
LSGATYGEARADLYYTAPIKLFGDGWAYSVGGYADSNKGTRSSPFTYQTYHFKGAVEKKFSDDGYIKVTYKRWDEHDPYYADMPYRYVNGQITGIPGLNTQSSNITGPGFASIGVPDSCFTGNCVRNFSSSNGIHSTSLPRRCPEIALPRPLLNLPTNTSLQWAFRLASVAMASNNPMPKRSDKKPPPSARYALTPMPASPRAECNRAVNWSLESPMKRRHIKMPSSKFAFKSAWTSSIEYAALTGRS